MKLKPSRKRALKSVRRFELAKALQALVDCEAELREIEMVSADLQVRISSVEGDLETDKKYKNTTAGVLEDEFIRVGIKRRELKTLLQKESAFRCRLRKMVEQFDRLKVSAVKAKRALGAVDDERE